MKKFLIPFMALALMGAVACSKDEDNNNEPPVDPATLPDANYVVGRFVPQYQLQSMSYDQMTATYTWNSDSTLKSMSLAGNTIAFTYDNKKRQTKIEYKENNTTHQQYTFTYNGDALKEFKLEEVNQYGNNTMMKGTTTYSGNRLQSVKYTDIHPLYAMELIESIVPSLNLKDDDPNVNVSNFTTNYTWKGPNVTKENSEIKYTINGSLGQLASQYDILSFNFDAILEQLGLSEVIPSEQIIPILEEYITLFGDSTCTVNSEATLSNEYTHDANFNPMYGLWTEGFIGQTICLCKNNCTSRKMSNKMQIGIKFSIPKVSDLPTGISLTLRGIIALISSSEYCHNGVFEFTFNKEFPSETLTATYSYDNLNRPIKVTSDGETLQYSYR